MTNKQALKKAREMFGKNALIADRKKPTITDKGRNLNDRFVVGELALGLFFNNRGWGPSWEEAFEMVRDKRRKERQEYIDAYFKHHGKAPGSSRLVPESKDPLLR